eukprot:Partr_v1_DN28155_c0_g1_i1_m55988 putative MethionyltRNA synthetase
MKSLRRLLSTRRQSATAFSTPIFYVNSDPHIGHLSSSVLADAMTRWHRLKHDHSSATLSTGTDEHGVKIQQAALSCGRSPQLHTDAVSARFKALMDTSNIDYDYFTRTTSPQHARVVHHIWNRLLDAGHIYKGQHSGWYSVSDEAFYTDNQVTRRMNLEGDMEVVATETDRPVEWVTEQNYKFRLSAFRERLIEWLESDKAAVDVVYPHTRKHQVLAWLKQVDDLPDFSVSRPVERQSWGIPVPGDPSNTIYVWIDALANYLTATGYPSSSSLPEFVHVIGKDILRFHAIYWPAMLMAADMPLPRQIVAHGHWTVGRTKMSKSLGNVVDPFRLMEVYGVDAVRYYLLRDGGLSIDGDFSESILRMRYQIELCDQMGNLLSRCLGKAVNPQRIVPRFASIGSEEHALFDEIDNLRELVDVQFSSGEFGKGLDVLMSSVHGINRYITAHEPWKMVKSNDENVKSRAATVIYACLESLRVIGILMQPAIPESMSKLLAKLGAEEVNISAAIVDRTGSVRGGVELKQEPAILFPRLPP